jgi:hypothetical protein
MLLLANVKRAGDRDLPMDHRKAAVAKAARVLSGYGPHKAGSLYLHDSITLMESLKMARLNSKCAAQKDATAGDGSTIAGRVSQGVDYWKELTLRIDLPSEGGGRFGH